MPNYKGPRPGTRRVVIWHKGKRRSWRLTGTKADGDRFEALQRLKLEANDHPTRSAPGFSWLCVQKYRPFAEANFARTTWRARSNILVSLQLFFREKRLTDFTSADTEAYKAHRREESKLGAVSMNTELRALQRVLRWAEKQGYPVTVPPIQFLKEPRGRVRLWTPAQVDAIMQVARERSPEVLRLIVFLVNTGCRKGEALAAEWSWVDFASRLIRIPANEAWRPKNGRAREVPMSDACREILAMPRQSEQWVFPNQYGDRWALFPDAIFKEIQTEAGVSGGAHTLRHCFASFFLQAKPDLPLLARILGHSHQRVTELYAHMMPDHLATAINVVNIGPPVTPTAPRAVQRSSKKARKA